MKESLVESPTCRRVRVLDPAAETVHQPGVLMIGKESEGHPALLCRADPPNPVHDEALLARREQGGGGGSAAPVVCRACELGRQSLLRGGVLGERSEHDESSRSDRLFDGLHVPRVRQGPAETTGILEEGQQGTPKSRLRLLGLAVQHGTFEHQREVPLRVKADSLRFEPGEPGDGEVDRQHEARGAEVAFRGGGIGSEQFFPNQT